MSNLPEVSSTKDILRTMFPYACSTKVSQADGNRLQVQWTYVQIGELSLWPIDSNHVATGRDWTYYADEFFFNDESDAVLFKLRWG